ncbi:glycosyltransferase [Serratia sp. 3ACOL1]|uniref:glycosyltransferase n=1 Tax=Serratia sp. 3ACOL1 TaxID=2448483 RepID=UPI000EF4FB3D|nr:glycosyltransferase [Serratia sp. 3ACOL1]AYM89690.1 glycosyltransferase [Serratia sp. 3ACOL1]
MKSKKWFDLTTSMLWTGGVVGIVRAELEIAAALGKLDDEIAFSMFKDGHFVEIPRQDIPWIFGDANVADEYLAKRTWGQQPTPTGQVSTTPATQKVNNFLSGLQVAIPSRGRRLQHSLALMVQETPTNLRPIIRVLAWLPSKTIGAVIKTRSVLSSNGTSEISHTTPNIVSNNTQPGFSHPYHVDDIILSVGWSDSGKETYFSKLKKQLPTIKIGYMVYDTILVGESTHHLYRPQEEENFRRYFSWISENCDFILYGGINPQNDGIAYQKKMEWRVPASTAIPYGGTDPIKVKDTSKDQEILKRLGVSRDFIMTVGTIEIRKNHDTLYKAFTMLIDNKTENLPQMVFVGKPGWRTADLIDTIRRDPRIGSNILILSPNDEELDALYRNCKFTLLPSFYEGWALPMPESFSYGKLCLAADVEPLREIGKQFAVYTDPLDIAQWAEKINFYINNPAELEARELLIKNEWHSTSWLECGSNILAAVNKYHDASFPSYTPFNMWYDLTLSYAVWRGGVTGIIRSELILAHNLEKLVPSLRFYAFYEGRFFEIPRENLSWLFESSDVGSQYAEFQRFWAEAEASGRGNRIPFDRLLPLPAATEIGSVDNKAVFKPQKTSVLKKYAQSGAYFVSALPGSLQNTAIRIADKLGVIPNSASPERIEATAALSASDINTRMMAEVAGLCAGPAQAIPFDAEDIVFSAGINWDPRPLAEIIKAKKAIGFKFSQIIYDATPLITPQLHAVEAYEWYNRFFYLSTLASDSIIYGGETAMRDGKVWQSSFGWPVADGIALKFGSDIAPQLEHSQDEAILHDMGITGPFMLSVGTLEIRKNHETLYKAYLKLLEEGFDQLPQLVFVGGAGWKAKDLFDVISRDSRVKGKILILRTTDQQLDVLYRHCKFTLLASLYEGWSLTLPESLGYQRFCLTSDVDPLRETGRDLVDYIHPWDVAGWASKIKYYSLHEDELLRREERIRNEWVPISWVDCAHQVIVDLKSIANKEPEAK